MSLIEQLQEEAVSRAEHGHKVSGARCYVSLALWRETFATYDFISALNGPSIVDLSTAAGIVRVIGDPYCPRDYRHWLWPEALEFSRRREREQGHRVGSMVVLCIGGNLHISKSHTPSESIVIERADIGDLLKAIADALVQV